MAIWYRVVVQARQATLTEGYNRQPDAIVDYTAQARTKNLASEIGIIGVFTPLILVDSVWVTQSRIIMPAGPLSQGNLLLLVFNNGHHGERPPEFLPRVSQFAGVSEEL
jgi:hypothetical protein